MRHTAHDWYVAVKNGLGLAREAKAAQEDDTQSGEEKERAFQAFVSAMMTLGRMVSEEDAVQRQRVARKSAPRRSRPRCG